jgi:hypothetical protein
MQDPHLPHFEVVFFDFPVFFFGAALLNKAISCCSAFDRVGRIPFRALSSRNEFFGLEGWNALISSDHRKSLPVGGEPALVCCMLWHAMHPVNTDCWSQVSRVVFEKLDFAPIPGKVFGGEPGVVGEFGVSGH